MKKAIGVLVGVLIAASLVLFGISMQKSKAKEDIASVKLDSNSKQEIQKTVEPEPPQPCPSETIIDGEVIPAGAPMERTWEKSLNRNGDEVCNGKLAITLSSNGSKVNMDDNRSGDEGTRFFRVRDYFSDISMVLLSAQYYESEKFILLSLADGAETDLFCEKPVFSPSKQFLFSHCLSLFEEGPRSGLGVWSIANGRLASVFTMEAGARDVQWQDDTTLLFTEVTADLNQDDRYKERTGMKLVNTEKGWQLVPPAEGAPPASPRVIARLGACGSDADLLGDRLHHLKGLTERLQRHNIPVIYQEAGFGCDIQFIANGDILVEHRIWTDSEFYTMARKHFQLPKLPGEE